MLRFVALAGLVALAVAQQGPPPFLQGAPAAKATEFQQLIASQSSQPDDVVDQKVKEWVGKQDASIQAAFAKFEAEVEAAQKEGEKAHQAAIAHFSPAAKDADAKLSTIADNKSLSVEQKGQQIDALLSSLPAAVRNEIETAMQG